MVVNETKIEFLRWQICIENAEGEFTDSVMLVPMGPLFTLGFDGNSL